MTGRKLPRKSQRAVDDDSKRPTRGTPAFVEGQGSPLWRSAAHTCAN